MQMYHVILGCSLAILLVILDIPQASCDDVVIQKRQVDPAEMDRLLDPKRKRPFCNAFTGCGKKRSDESMGTLVEMNSEPAVDDLSRQILSEAKLWEAIQEARVELLRRRQEQLQQQSNQFGAGMDRPLPLPIAGYRRKRFADPESQAPAPHSNLPRATSQLQEEITKPWSR
ncbi:cardioactive peptide [Periplaneta americana]|uniref:cardioactive peptide n=1 Tax=Periplaneta americana TaxID=6978 RepID=UPI0037E909B0